MEAPARETLKQLHSGTPPTGGSPAHQQQEDQQLLPSLALGQKGPSSEKLPRPVPGKAPARCSDSIGSLLPRGQGPPSTTLSLGSAQDSADPAQAPRPAAPTHPAPAQALAPALPPRGSPPQPPSDQDLPPVHRKTPPSPEQATRALFTGAVRRRSWVQHSSPPQGQHSSPPHGQHSSPSPGAGSPRDEAGSLTCRTGASALGQWPRWLLGPMERQGDLSGTCSSTATATAAPAAPAAGAAGQGQRRAEQEVSQQLRGLQGDQGPSLEEPSRKRKSPCGVREAEGPPREALSERLRALSSCARGHEDPSPFPGLGTQVGTTEKMLRDGSERGGVRNAGRNGEPSRPGALLEALPRPSSGAQMPDALFPPPRGLRSNSTGNMAAVLAAVLDAMPPSSSTTSSTSTGLTSPVGSLGSFPLGPSSMSPSEWALSRTQLPFPPSLQPQTQWQRASQSQLLSQLQPRSQSQSQSQAQLQWAPSLQSQSQSQSQSQPHSKWASQSLLHSRSDASLLTSMGGSMEVGRGAASIPAPSSSGIERQAAAHLSGPEPVPPSRPLVDDWRLNRFGPQLLGPRHHSPPSPGRGTSGVPSASPTTSPRDPSLLLPGEALHWGNLGFAPAPAAALLPPARTGQRARSGEHASPPGMGKAWDAREEGTGHLQLSRMAGTEQEQLRILDDRVVGLWHTMHLASSRRAALGVPLVSLPSAEPSVGLLGPNPARHALREQVGSSRLDAQQSASGQLLQGLHHHSQLQQQQVRQQVEQGQLLARHQLWLSRAQAAAAAAAAAADASNATWLPGREHRAATGGTAATTTTTAAVATAPGTHGRSQLAFSSQAPAFALPTAGLSGPNHLMRSDGALSGGRTHGAPQASWAGSTPSSGVSSSSSSHGLSYSHSLSSRSRGPELAPLLRFNSSGLGSPRDLWHGALLHRQLLGSSDSASLLDAAAALPAGLDAPGHTLRAALSTAGAEDWRARLRHTEMGPAAPGDSLSPHAAPSGTERLPGFLRSTVSAPEPERLRGTGMGDGDAGHAGAGVGAGGAEWGAPGEASGVAELDSAGAAYVVEVQSAEGAQAVDAGHDGFAWRKYGKKHIKDAEYPRTYYRCAVETCSAKKHMQRVPRDEGPTPTFLCTYDGQHNHPMPYAQGGFSPGSSSSSASRPAGALNSQAPGSASAAAAPEGEWAKSGHGAPTLVRPAQQGFQPRRARIIARSDWARALLQEKDQEQRQGERGRRGAEQAGEEGGPGAEGQAPESEREAKGLSGSSSRAQQGNDGLKTAAREQQQEDVPEGESRLGPGHATLPGCDQTEEGGRKRKAGEGDAAALLISVMAQESQGEPLPSVLHSLNKKQRHGDPCEGGSLSHLERLPEPSEDEPVAAQPLTKPLGTSAPAHGSGTVASTMQTGVLPSAAGLVEGTADISMREEYPRIFGALLMPHQPGN